MFWFTLRRHFSAYQLWRFYTDDIWCTETLIFAMRAICGTNRTVCPKDLWHFHLLWDVVAWVNRWDANKWPTNSFDSNFWGYSMLPLWIWQRVIVGPGRPQRACVCEWTFNLCISQLPQVWIYGYPIFISICWNLCFRIIRFYINLLFGLHINLNGSHTQLLKSPHFRYYTVQFKI